MKILVTGGAGYIGSHTLVDLLNEEHDLFVIDNFSNSSPHALASVRELTGKTFLDANVDINDEAKMDEVFSSFKPEAVFHFAGLKAVGEGENYPLHYYQTNVGGSMNLLKCMEKHCCNSLVFSSSATIYGEPHYLPYDENHPIAPVNVYGKTKYFIEQIICDWTKAHKDRRGVLLRYFNPIGAHQSGLIGENPRGKPNNLMPLLLQVAMRQRDNLSVFGTDYDTVDGSGVRDYLHVCDLAAGHVAALDYLDICSGVEAINLGTGRGTSVLQLIRCFEDATSQSVPYRIAERRLGDVATSVADPARAEIVLRWIAKRSVTQACSDAWNWITRDPT